MKETGIIMSGDHPRLILDGRKTMTRRVVKHPAIPNSDIVGVKEYLYVPAQEHPSEIDVPEGYYALLKCNANQDRNTTYFRSPYGQVGDRLWVRETWRILDDTMLLDDEVRIEYRADRQIINRRYGDIAWNEAGMDLPVIQSAMEDGKWKPAHHLPHIISRITLEITEVRVERLQEIGDDVLDEGFVDTDAFIVTWDSLNAKRGYGWEVNPWLWVISFKVKEA